MPLGILNVQDTLFKIHIFPGEQPCFVCADPAAVKEPEKDGNGNFPYEGLLPAVDDRYMVALMEKAAEFFLRESMGDIDPPFFPGGSVGVLQERDPGCSGNGQSCPPHRSLTGRNCLFPCPAGGTIRQPFPASARYPPDSFPGSSGRTASGSLHRKSRSSAVTPAGTV